MLKLSQDVEEAGPLPRDKRRWWKPKVTENVILFIDELHTIVGAGSAESAMDASNIIKPALSRGELQCVGATTLSEYRKYIGKDAALERRFQTVMIEAPTVEEAFRFWVACDRSTRHTTKPSLPMRLSKQPS